jgi:hypothetical protein
VGSPSPFARSATEGEEREARAAEKVIEKATEKQDAKPAAKIAHKEARIVAMTEPLVDALRNAKMPPTSQKWIALDPEEGQGKSRHLEVAS